MTHHLSLNLFRFLCLSNNFCSYVCNWRARMFASEVTAQHNSLPSHASKNAPGRA